MNIMQPIKSGIRLMALSMALFAMPAVAQIERPVLQVTHNEDDLDDNHLRIMDTAISPDGSKLATCVLTGLKVWDMKTGDLLMAEKPGRFTQFNSVSFSPNEEYVAASGDHLWTKVWEISTGQALAEFQGPVTWNYPAAVLITAFVPNGHELIAVGHPGKIAKMNIFTGERTIVIDLGERVYDLYFYPGGSKLLANVAGKGLVISYPEGEILHRFRGGVTLSGDGTRVFALAREEYPNRGFSISVYDALTYERLSKSEPFDWGYRDTRFTANGQYILAKTANGRIRLLDSGTTQRVRSFTDNEDRVYEAGAFKFSPDGKRFAAVEGNRAYIYDISDLVTAVPNAELHRE